MNRTTPEVRLIPHIIDYLGYVPYDPNWSFGERLRAVRSAIGLSQDEFAKKIGVNESTVGAWERKEHKPSKIKIISLLKGLPTEIGLRNDKSF